MTDYIITEEKLIWACNGGVTTEEEQQIRSNPLSEKLQKEREKVLDEFKWMRPLCFGRHEAICDTRCAWVVRERCIKSLRGEL